MNAIPNQTVTRQDIMDLAGTLGRQEGSGSQSRSALAVTVTRAAFNRVIAANDAADIWDKFQRGKAAEQRKLVEGSKNKDGTVKTEGRDDFVSYTESDSDKVQISKLNTFIKLGLLPETRCASPVDVIIRAGQMVVDIMNQPVPDGKKKPSIRTFDALVTVARRQTHKDRVGQLTDDEIRAAILGDETGDEKDPKGEMELIEAQIKSLKGIRDDSAISWLEARHAELLAMSANAKMAALAIKLAPQVQAAAQGLPKPE